MNKYAKDFISPKDFEVILSCFVQKKIRKRQYLLQEGMVCDSFAFILKGSVRQYYIDEKNVERIVNLYVENWWVGDQESFVNGTPSVFNIDAWEDSEVLFISREKILNLCQQYPSFNDLLLTLIEQNNIATQRRLTSINFNAKQRYMCLLANYPVFIDRFPQHIIASYLGITKDTLSRVLRK